MSLSLGESRGGGAGRLFAGLLLLAGAAGVGRLPQPDPILEAEPVAAALAPLGPLKALASAALWTAALRGQQWGDVETVVSVAEGLLALHPTLDSVREYLAHVLVVNEALRAPDAPRHRALVLRGLQLLEDGVALTGSARLHGALGRLLAARCRADAAFRQVALEYFGQPPEQIAIDELRQSRRPSPDSLVLADLLMARGRDAFAGRDYALAARDLSEAEVLLRELLALDGAEFEPLLQELRVLQDEVSARWRRS